MVTGKVLLVDDDVELVELLRDYLAREGFTVEVAHDGAMAVSAMLTASHDIVVLDIMMPVMNGIEALARIRACSSIPVIMLTARGDDADRVVGLEMGADDYVPKPCTPRELVARIRAVLRRTGVLRNVSALPISVGDLSIFPGQRSATLAGIPVELTSTEFSLILALARNAGHPVSKAELSQAALGRPLTRFDRSVDVHMSSIRHKVGLLPDGRSRIQTVIRKGYQLLVD